MHPPGSPPPRGPEGPTPPPPEVARPSLDSLLVSNPYEDVPMALSGNGLEALGAVSRRVEHRVLPDRFTGQPRQCITPEGWVFTLATVQDTPPPGQQRPAPALRVYSGPLVSPDHVSRLHVRSHHASDKGDVVLGLGSPNDVNGDIKTQIVIFGKPEREGALDAVGEYRLLSPTKKSWEASTLYAVDSVVEVSREIAAREQTAPELVDEAPDMEYERAELERYRVRVFDTAMKARLDELAEEADLLKPKGGWWTFAGADGRLFSIVEQRSQGGVAAFYLQAPSDFNPIPGSDELSVRDQVRAIKAIPTEQDVRLALGGRVKRHEFDTGEVNVIMRLSQEALMDGLSGHEVLLVTTVAEGMPTTAFAQPINRVEESSDNPFPTQ